MDSPQTALLIIDMQNDFVLPGAPACIDGAHATLPRIRELLAFFRAARNPVVHILRSYLPDGSNVERLRREAFLRNPFVVEGTPGQRVVADIEPLPGETVIVKSRFSAFFRTSLDDYLERKGITALAICGTQYPACVRATVMDAVSRDLDVTLITDATSAATPEVAAANIRDLMGLGVRCITTDSFLTSL